MQITPIVLIDALRESDPYIETIYMKGSCYRLHLMLKKLWPDALPVTNASGDHVGSVIGGVAYDINGVVDWSYRDMDYEDTKEAMQWSFANNSMLQIGTCPICEEPIVA
jgi:hypothetical protein